MTESKFYITTAINYTNGSPHFGHCYEAVVADCLARYHRFSGKEVFFLTGSDEHGQKIADTATAQSLEPIELCDKYVQEFQSLNAKMNVSNDFYIRTTSEKHETLAKYFWELCDKNGDIYLGKYTGWYSKREERFVTETEAKEMNYKDGTQDLIQTSEPSYFFKMSKYHDQLVQYIKDHPDFIFPEEKRNEILERLKVPLFDLSISRTSFNWGIPLPEGYEKNHVMYVWFDALTNYLSGIDWPNGELAKFWPADVHLIGKDITWFHAVIWPCMLFSAGIPLPKQIVCHGFVNGPDGRKMSKTWGNIVDPVVTLQSYKPDVIRYFILREGVFGSDFNFSSEYLETRHDGDLADNLGNLVYRIQNLTKRYSDSKVPVESAEPIFDLEDLAKYVDLQYNKYNLQNVINRIFSVVADLNKWIEVKSPWKLKGEEHDVPKKHIVRNLLEALYILAHYLEPIMPELASKIFKFFNTKQVTLEELKQNAWKHLVPGTEILQGEPLFPRIKDTKFDKKKQ